MHGIQIFRRTHKKSLFVHGKILRKSWWSNHEKILIVRAYRQNLSCKFCKNWLPNEKWECTAATNDSPPYASESQSQVINSGFWFWSRSSCSQMFFNIGVLKKFRKFHRKKPVLESYFNKDSGLKAWKPATLLKRDFNTSVFLWNLRNF